MKLGASPASRSFCHALHTFYEHPEQANLRKKKKAYLLLALAAILAFSACELSGWPFIRMRLFVRVLPCRFAWFGDYGLEILVSPRWRGRHDR
jgi:hypothetical protein